MKQKLENLPEELKEQRRFTPALEDKRPAYPAGISWNDSANWWNLNEVKTVKRGKDYKAEAPKNRRLDNVERRKRLCDERQSVCDVRL